MNPGTVLAIHSYKGGTGKTLISINLATILAKHGKNTCLIDHDLRAPSLDVTFTADGKYWINDFLSGECEPMDMLKDFSNENATKGKLLVALADPSMGTIRETVTNQRGWHMRALRQLLSLKNFLINDLATDYVLIDTSPGMSYGSINTVTASDLVMVISTWDASDIAGTRGMIRELYTRLGKRAIVVVNKIPEQLIMGEGMRERITNQFKRAFKLPVVGLLSCYCDVLKQERTRIMALDMPDHQFSKSLVEVVGKLDLT